MKPIAYTLAIAAMCLTLSAQGKPVPKSTQDENKEKIAPETKKELEALQGEWTLVSFINPAGREMKGKKGQLTIKGDRWIISTDKFSQTFKIDPSKNPKTIDLIFPDKTFMLGIYKLEGDQLTVCQKVGPKGPARPEEFNTDGKLLFVWKREKK